MNAKRRAGKAPGPSKDSAALYLYCIGERETLVPLFEGKLPAPIESPSSLEMVEADGLAAVAGAVPLSDYAEESLRARLADPTWTAVRAMRHEGVVEHFARRAGVVPLRFGTIYLRRESIEQMLVARGAQFREIIERLRGREEWGVNVYADRTKLREAIAEASPVLREMAARAAEASPGQAYLLRKKIDAMRGDEARAETRRVAFEVESKLAGLCDATARLRVLKDEASEHGDLVAKFAFLVRREGFDAFRTGAEQLAALHASSGFRFELTGPWPAYNFAGEREEKEERKGVEEAKK